MTIKYLETGTVEILDLNTWIKRVLINLGIAFILTSLNEAFHIMRLNIQQLTKDLSQIDLDDIVSAWNWKLVDMKAIAIISCLGDIFLVGNDNSINWLQTDSGELTKIAKDLEQFEHFLDDADNVDNWFLPSLIEKLIQAGKVLKVNEVYNYKKLPVLGGEYSIENIEVVNMRIHFALTGQICEQIKDLPDGTKVKTVIQNK